MNELMKLTAFLDRTLNVGDFPDVSHNGLQVANSGGIARVCAGVDASMEFFEAAARRKADLLICHHGLSWGDSLKRLTGINYRRIKFLMDHDMALYACHLPLDVHPRYGNNARICRALGLRGLKPFGRYNGIMLGFKGMLPKPVKFPAFKQRLRRIFGELSGVMEFGKPLVRSVAVVSGGAADEIAEAGEDGIDVYISGEPKLTAWHLAREHGIHAIFGGHYATEKFGVRALADLVAARFPIAAEFVDLGTRY